MLWSKRKNLPIEEQRKIIAEQFQKLKDKFLTNEQKAIVHLKELPEIYWLVYEPWSCGLTFYDYSAKDSHMYVSVRLFSQHENMPVLLDTITHEFAHVYLNFTNPKHTHGEEHTKQKQFFLKYLILG